MPLIYHITHLWGVVSERYRYSGRALGHGVVYAMSCNTSEVYMGFPDAKYEELSRMLVTKDSVTMVYLRRPYYLDYRISLKLHDSLDEIGSILDMFVPTDKAPPCFQEAIRVLNSIIENESDFSINWPQCNLPDESTWRTGGASN